MLKKHIADVLAARPRAFDAAKRASRAFGVTNPVYELLRDLAVKYPRCRFLQCGSNDGLRLDPLREFVIRSEWTGILVEPLPWVFERLGRNYRRRRAGLYFENAAVSSETGTGTLYVAREGARGLESQFSSLYRGHVLNHGVTADEVAQVPVALISVRDLLAKHGFDNIDLLHVDAEGHDAAILRGIDFSVVTPEFIIFERSHLGQQEEAALNAYLEDAGYRISPGPEDSIAVRL